MATQEENVLVIRDPSLENENDWEEFSLVDVKVNLPNKTRYANILTASEDNPLDVSGRLEEVEDEQIDLVKDENYRSKRITISNVKHYAYGQHQDGEVGIWVAGQAGWFLIAPAKGYKAVYKEMVEAIDLLYFLADQYHGKDLKRKKRKRSPNLNRLYQEYVYHTNRRCADTEDAADVFMKHRAFIISQMLQGREDIDWEATPFYAYLEKNYEDEFQSIREQLSPKQDMDVSNEEEREAQAGAIFETINDMVDAGMLARRQLHIDSISEALVERYDIANKDDATHLVRARASDIIELMHGVPTSTRDWRRRALYRELQGAIESEDEVDDGDTQMETKSSEDNEERVGEEGEEVAGEEDEQEAGEEEEAGEDEEDEEVAEEEVDVKQGVDEADIEEDEGEETEQPENEESSSEESEEETPPPSPRGRRRRVRKSILRPMTVSAKGAGKRNKMIDTTDSNEDEDDSNPETPTKRGGHQFIHDPLSVRANEKRRSPSSNAIRKLALEGSIGNSTQSAAMATSDDSGVELVHDAELPPDTWVCLVKGCNKTVFKASTKRSKEIIEDHSLVHAEDTKSKLDLVLAEHRLNINMPVDNLLSRIRGSRALLSAAENMEDMPSPQRVKE